MDMIGWVDAKEGEAYQDRLDGAALRRLREALPDWHVKVDAAAGYVEVKVLLHSQVMAQFWGATIAEAADKCREALERPTADDGAEADTDTTPTRSAP